jgi:hypothetical protein
MSCFVPVGSLLIAVSQVDSSVPMLPLSPPRLALFAEVESLRAIQHKPTHLRQIRSLNSKRPAGRIYPVLPEYSDATKQFWYKEPLGEPFIVKLEEGKSLLGNFVTVRDYHELDPFSITKTCSGIGMLVTQHRSRFNDLLAFTTPPT